MTQEEIYVVLNKMLEDPKAKTFLNHLIRAYMPITNVSIVGDKPKGDFKCVITRDALVSVNDMKAILDEKEGAFFSDNLKKALGDKTENSTAMETFLAGRKLAVTGKDTTTFMSHPVSQVFIDWVITQSLTGDKHINWVLGGIRRASLIERAEKIKNSDVQKKVDNFKKENGVKTATFSLSDSSDVLAKFKAQLEASESKGK